MLSCEQKLFSQKKWHFEKSLHFPPQGLQKKVLSQDSLMEEKIYMLSLKKRKKGFPWEIEGWGRKKVLSVWKCLWNCIFISLALLEFLSVFIAQSSRRRGASPSSKEEVKPLIIYDPSVVNRERWKVFQRKAAEEKLILCSLGTSLFIDCRHLGSPKTSMPNFGF